MIHSPQKDNFKKIIIAVDGYSSSGKSTMARSLAQRLNYRYIDSGAMYRAVTLYAIRADLLNDSHRLICSLPAIKIDFQIMPDGRQHTFLNGEDVEKEIRSMAVSEHVSSIAAIPEVRREMVRQQQAFGEGGGVVMDGRDICTTVFPNAELKIFVNASAETRAKRRYEELQAKGDSSTTYEQVLNNLKQRDYTDTHRGESPMHPASDAVILDNSDMTIDEQNAWVDSLVAKRIASVNK